MLGWKVKRIVIPASPSIEGLWEFCRERESIRLHKEAKDPPPWTEDQILQKYHFCNIRRQDDRGTQHYVKNVVPESESYEDLIWKTILYRAVNNIEWFEGLVDGMGSGVFGVKEWENYGPSITEAIRSAPLPYSPAYIVLQGPDGKDRKTHLIQLLDEMYLGAWNVWGIEEGVRAADNLRSVWKLFQNLPYIGPFISLQIYRDLILVGAMPFDDDEFTYLGPGCRTGIEMLLNLKRYDQQYAALQKLKSMVPEDLRPMSLGDMEHVVCEARKYWNLRKGTGRHRYYKPDLAIHGGFDRGSQAPGGLEVTAG